MPLTRRTQASGTSVVVTIPNEIVDEYNINVGDLIEIIPQDGEIRIRKFVS